MFAHTSAISVKSHSLNAARWNPTASKFMEWLTSMITSREGQRYVHFCGSIYFQEYNSFWLIQWSKKNNDLIFVFSVCRCMCAKIVATLLQNPKFIIYTWKTTILLVRLFTNSMTRGISSSQMQILLTCYSRLILKKKHNWKKGIFTYPHHVYKKSTFIIFLSM